MYIQREREAAGAPVAGGGVRVVGARHVVHDVSPRPGGNTCTYECVCIYIYICIYRERDQLLSSYLI